MADSGGENSSRPRGWLVLKHHVLTHKVICFILLNKLALLWGEAQKKIAYSYLKMTLCYPNVNYSGLKVTYS